MIDLRQLPAGQSVLLRIIALGLALWSIFVAKAAPGLDGRHLVVLIATVVAVLCWISWTATSITSRYRDAVTPDLYVMAAAGGVLTFAADGGAGSVFAFAAVISTGARVPIARSAAVVAVAVIAVVATGIAYGLAGPGVLAYAVGFVAAVLAGNGRRLANERTEQAELLLAQTQRSQEETLRSARLQEQARIAREIHDVLAHSLAGLTIQLEATAALIEQGADRDDVLTRVRRAHELARDGLHETRAAVGVLRGDRLTTRARVDALIDAFRTDTDSEVALRVETDLDAVDGDRGDTVVRVIQEALTNIRKHAPGAAVTVLAGRDGDGLRVVVRDTGTDTPSTLAASGGGYGITGMHERATAVGGTLDAGPEAGGGWQVVLRIPLEAGA